MRSIPDEQFVDWSHGLQRSDRTAFSALFEATYDSFFGYACSYLRDSEAAHDVLQDVYLKLWQVRATVDPDRSLKALLYQMVRNYSLNHERRKRKHAGDSIDDSEFEPAVENLIEDEFDSRTLGARIEKWIEEMPGRRREAFVLSRFEGLSHEEIARIMDLTSRTVNNHIVLALQHLRGRLHAYDATPAQTGK